MRAGTNQCGCNDCYNPSDYTPCGDEVVCDSGSECPEAPCAFAALFCCNWRKRDLFIQEMMVLWKETLFNNDDGWTARRCLDAEAATMLGCGVFFADEDIPAEGYDDGEHPCVDTESLGFGDATGTVVQNCPPMCVTGYTDSGRAEYANTTLSFGCSTMWPQRIAVDVTGFPAGVSGARRAYTCGWYDFFDAYEITESTNPAFPVGGVFSASELGIGAGSPNFPCIRDYRKDWLAAHTQVVWRLTIEGSDGVMKGYDNGELVVTYRTPDGETFDCQARNNLELEDWPQEDWPGLPRFVCVVPYSSDWQSWCDTKEHACACGDAGVNNVCLTSNSHCAGALLSFQQICRYFSFPNMSGISGDQLCDSASWSGSYLYSASAECVEWPDNAPCGVFFYTTANDLCAEYTSASFFGQTAWMIWCDGEVWHLRIWCILVCSNAGGCTHAELGTYSDGELAHCEIIVDAEPETFEIAEDGARWTFDIDIADSPCCCRDPIGCECCIDPGYPETFYMTVTAGCADLLGQVVALTLVETDPCRPDTDFGWRGTVDNGDCTIEFVLYIATAVCRWHIKTTGDVCAADRPVIGPADICPWENIEDLTFSCECCGSITVDITE